MVSKIPPSGLVFVSIVLLVTLTAWQAAPALAGFTPTPAPPTDTPVPPPTNTPVTPEPPTVTPGPPTETPVTPGPPTETPVTPEPPTETPVTPGPTPVTPEPPAPTSTTASGESPRVLPTPLPPTPDLTATVWAATPARLPVTGGQIDVPPGDETGIAGVLVVAMLICLPFVGGGALWRLKARTSDSQKGCR